jgi:hypothetical protein|tara:strand:+ start:474 stop:737 length:264 start_codon:yes stop_codon:yes gene_type:complete
LKDKKRNRIIERDRQLTTWERLATRIGYLGAGLLIAGQWTLEPVLFVIGFTCVTIQVTVRKQWNLVVLQLNGLIAWTVHFINSLSTS